MAASSAATAKAWKRARMGSPSFSATDRSAISMAAAPSVICEEFPAVMSGAVSGSNDCAGGSAASASRVVVRAGCPRRGQDLTGEVPSSSRMGTGMASWAKWPESVASRGAPVALERVGVHVLAG